MSRLERLGFDVAAGHWLELHRGHGRLLRLLVEAEGAIVTYDELLRDDYRHSRVEPSREVRQTAASPLISPVSRNRMKRTRSTCTPENRAAVALLPIT